MHCGNQLPTTVGAEESPCPACKKNYGWVSAAALHDGPLRPAIHALKYDGRVELASTLARYLRAVTAETPWPSILHLVDVLAPVPLHTDRQLERGYNQAELLTVSLAAHARKPVLNDAIVRVEATRPQVGLSRSERANNVLGKFWVDRKKVAGMTLLLIDDVFTTGATMRECAAALRREGAVAVYGLALARPITDQ